MKKKVLIGFGMLSLTLLLVFNICLSIENSNTEFSLMGLLNAPIAQAENGTKTTKCSSQTNCAAFRVAQKDDLGRIWCCNESSSYDTGHIADSY